MKNVFRLSVSSLLALAQTSIFAASPVNTKAVAVPQAAAKMLTEQPATGLKPPTQAEKDWMDQNMVTTAIVLPNQLGLSRLNESRKSQGLPEIYVPVVPFGQESLSKKDAEAYFKSLSKKDADAYAAYYEALGGTMAETYRSLVGQTSANQPQNSIPNKTDTQKPYCPKPLLSTVSAEVAVYMELDGEMRAFGVGNATTEKIAPPGGRRGEMQAKIRARDKATAFAQNLSRRARAILGGKDQAGNPISIHEPPAKQAIWFDPDHVTSEFSTKGQFYTPEDYLRKVKSLQIPIQYFPYPGGRYFVKINATSKVYKPVQTTAPVSVSVSVQDNLYRGKFDVNAKSFNMSGKDYQAAIDKAISTIKTTLTGTDSLGKPINFQRMKDVLWTMPVDARLKGVFGATGQFTPQDATMYIVKAKTLNNLPAISTQTKEGMRKVTINVSYVDGNKPK